MSNCSVVSLLQDLKKDVSRQSIDDSAFEALEKDFQEVITLIFKTMLLSFCLVED